MEERQSHEIKLPDSTLWRYLTAIRGNQSILSYFQEELLPLQLPNDQLVHFNTLSNFCAYIHQTNYFNPRYHFFYTDKMTVEYLTQQTQFILENVVQWGKPQASNLDDWIGFPLAQQATQLAVSQAYLELESVLASMLMLTRWSLTPQKSLLHTLCNAKSNRKLNGESLVFLDSHHCQLLNQLLELSILLHLHIQGVRLLEEHIDAAKQQRYQQWLTAIDHLLERLTVSDWQQFLENDQFDSLHPRTRLLAKALEFNHPLIPSELAESAVHKLTQLKEANSSFSLTYRFMKPSSLDKLLGETAIPRQNKTPDVYTLEGLQSYTKQLKDAKEEATIHLVPAFNKSPALQPTQITQPAKQQDESPKSSSFNWGLGLKIGTAIVLGALGIGFLLTGFGIFASIPLFAQATFITLGIFCCATSVGVTASTCFSDCKKPKKTTPVKGSGPTAAHEPRIQPKGHAAINNTLNHGATPSGESICNTFHESLTSASYAPTFSQTRRNRRCGETLNKTTTTVVTVSQRDDVPSPFLVPK